MPRGTQNADLSPNMPKCIHECEFAITWHEPPGGPPGEGVVHPHSRMGVLSAWRTRHTAAQWVHDGQGLRVPKDTEGRFPLVAHALSTRSVRGSGRSPPAIDGQVFSDPFTALLLPWGKSLR